MADRHKPHNGRDLDGHFKVKQADVEELETDPQGADFVRDDVRLGGAVEDVGASAGQHAARISDLVDENRRDVDHATGRDRDDSRRGKKNRGDSGMR